MAGPTKWALRLCAAAALIYAVLILPNHPAAMTWGALGMFPLEWPAILLALAFAGPGRAGQALRVGLVAALVLITVLKLADYAMFTALARSFNPVADPVLAAAGLRLLAGAVGPAVAALALLGAVLGVAALAAALWWATGTLCRAAPSRRAARALAGTGALACAGFAMLAETSDARLPGAAFTARVGTEKLIMARATLADLRRFEAAAKADPFLATPPALDLLDRDVIVVFVESYGRTSLDTPYYADLHAETLRTGAQMLAAQGLASASGMLASPTRGGQSWLAHATFANGLKVNGQTRYGAVLASGRQTLYHFAARAGFHTAAVMPQITLDWPESATMGFETVLAAADLGYKGRNFNWVTMPDQFTFAAMDRLLRDAPRERHSFIQLATGSSHAPWVPVPEMVDWSAIGDGRIFNAMAEAGEPPEMVWRDHGRVRAQYRLAVDYALQVILAYAARHAADPPLMIVMGDHQAAEFVALDTRPDVPIHVIGPAPLVARAQAAWGLSAGLVPPASTEPVPMEAMRDLFLRAFSTGAAPPAPGAGG